ncbi:hypothetical protein ACQJBY_005368 [Aegilops geniculata]
MKNPTPRFEQPLFPPMDPPPPRRWPASSATPSSAEPSSPHTGLPPLRRALLPALSESSARYSATPRHRPPHSGPRRPARAHAADRHRLLNTLLSAAGNGREEEDTREAGQHQNQHASDPADAYGDTDAEALAAAAALPPVITFPMAFSVQLFNLVVFVLPKLQGNQFMSTRKEVSLLSFQQST